MSLTPIRFCHSIPLETLEAEDCSGTVLTPCTSVSSQQGHSDKPWTMGRVPHKLTKAGRAASSVMNLLELPKWRYKETQSCSDCSSSKGQPGTSFIITTVVSESHTCVHCVLIQLTCHCQLPQNHPTTSLSQVHALWGRGSRGPGPLNAAIICTGVGPSVGSRTTYQRPHPRRPFLIQ